jgi:hypothetical protein
MKTVHLVLIGAGVLAFVCIALLEATHNHLGRWHDLPVWFWVVLLTIVAEHFLLARWLSPNRSEERSLLRYGAVQASHFTVVFFLFNLTGSALEPRIDWANSLLMGVFTGLAFGVVLAVARRNALLSASSRKIQ